MAASSLLLPPNGQQEIVFSFDTTGSMSGCIAEVKGRLQDMMQRLQADIPAIKIAVFAHGDYCDKRNYITRHIDFTNNITDLCDFVNTTKSTGGGDFAECYELVLSEVRTKLSWTPSSQRSLVVIGDAIPHDPHYPENTQNIDWTEEVQSLKEMGVKIYAVQCGSNPTSTPFYKHMAEKSAGKHLALSEFGNIFDFLMAICYREQGAEFLQTYEKEVRARYEDGSVNKDLEGMFESLRPSEVDDHMSDDSSESARPTETKPVKLTKKRLAPEPPSDELPVQKKRLKGPKPVKVEKSKRENVPMRKFVLNDLKWTSWKMAMVPSIPRGSRHWWVGRGEDKPGFRRDTLFRGMWSVPALYEVSVQSKSGSRRFVVYSKFITGRKDGHGWERFLFNNRNIQCQLDTVLESRCTVYLRRAVCPKTACRKMGSQLTRSYDYAWRAVRYVRNTHRDVIKNDVSISSSSL